MTRTSIGRSPLLVLGAGVAQQFAGAAAAAGDRDDLGGATEIPIEG